MQSFKSSPLLMEQPQRLARRSRRTSKQPFPEEKPFVIANPFLAGNQENYIPNNLMQQISQHEYISS